MLFDDRDISSNDGVRALLGTCSIARAQRADGNRVRRLGTNGTRLSDEASLLGRRRWKKGSAGLGVCVGRLQQGIIFLASLLELLSTLMSLTLSAVSLLLRMMRGSRRGSLLLARRHAPLLQAAGARLQLSTLVLVLLLQAVNEAVVQADLALGSVQVRRLLPYGRIIITTVACAA